MENYEKYMQKCLDLALLGEGQVSPNPLVGCVVLDKNGNEISSGFHAKYGEKHAEAKALENINAEGGTLIVNLEPCSHFGKTPPCADLIIEKKIKKVIIAMKDPNLIVSGRGIEKLKNAEIEVIIGVLEEKARKLNEIFIKNHEKKAIFVATKIASTLDGKIATKTGASKWITGEIAREEVKKIRNRYDAILTTSATVLKDNPSMKHKTKIILDRNFKTDLNSKIYQTGGKIFVVTDEMQEITSENITQIKCPIIDNKLDLKFLFKKLYELGLRSVLAEAGGIFNGNLIQSDLADKIYQFIAPKIICDNSAKSCYDGSDITEINQAKNFRIEEIQRFGEDIMFELYRN